MEKKLQPTETITTESAVTTPEQELMRNIGLEFKEYEKKLFNIRVKQGYIRKSENGVYPFKQVIGYKSKKTDTYHETIVIDEEKSCFVRTAFELRLEGKTLKEISEELHKRGFRNSKGNIVDSTRIGKILKNPVYCGEIRCYGKIYHGNHQPIISEEQFNQVQNTFKYKSRKKKSDKNQGNAIIYARSATDNRFSIENQVDTCNEFAQKNNYNIVKTFTDNGYSGRKKDNPAFLEMIEYIKTHDNIHALIVRGWDRLSRSAKFLCKIKSILDEKGIKLVNSYNTFEIPFDFLPNENLYSCYCKIPKEPFLVKFRNMFQNLYRKRA